MNQIASQSKPVFRAWALALFAAWAMLQAIPVQSQTASDYHQRADVLLENYLVKYWDGNYIRNTGEWTYIHGMDAVVDGVERTGKQKYAGLIETFYEAQDRRHGWLNDYYDDENWFVLTLIHAYDVTGQTKYLNKAREIFADIQTTAPDTTCCGTIPGGLWWNKQKTQKATAANAGAVISAMRLYQRTGDKKYRNFGKQVYEFWWTNMVNKSTYQVADHINTDGSITWWKFTYNEGLMIGASLEMYNTYGKQAYLTNAHNIAGFMINNETVATPYGKALSDGTAAQCGGDCHQFKGPGYRYLMQLYLKDKSRTAYYDVLKASVDALWNLARTSDNSVGVDWAGPAQDINDRTQNAAAQAMSLFARQTGAYPGSGIPQGQYEAEDATIRGILLEANQPGFTSWGFVGGWINTGTFVQFTVNNPTAGAKTVTFRYAAAAGEALRNIVINGVPVTTLKFPGTSGWNVFGTTSFTHDFPAGTSTVLVGYQSNYVNLDHMSIAPVAPSAVRKGILEAEGSGQVEVYPNPVRNQEVLTIRLFARQPTKATLELTSMLAKPLVRVQKALQAGRNTVQVPLTQVPPGTYLLNINQGTHRDVKKIVVSQ